MPILSALGGGSAKGFSGGGGPHPIGEAVFFTPGSTTWTIPSGVKRISILAVGAGGAGGGAANSATDAGGGGALVWANDISVAGLSTLNVFVGDTNRDNNSSATARGGEGSFVSAGGSYLVRTDGAVNLGGTVDVGEGFAGGQGGHSHGDSGGGAGGYSAAGGNVNSNGTGGSGAGGRDGSSITGSDTATYSNKRYYSAGAGGGGVGIYGEQGDDPTTTGAYTYPARAGQGGSFQEEQTHIDTGIVIRPTGLNGSNALNYIVAGAGGFPGGGGGSGGRYYRTTISTGVTRNSYYSSAFGSPGAVRIIFGKDRFFPASDVGLRQDGSMELFDT